MFYLQKISELQLHAALALDVMAPSAIFV